MVTKAISATSALLQMSLPRLKNSQALLKKSHQKIIHANLMKKFYSLTRKSLNQLTAMTPTHRHLALEVLRVWKSYFSFKGVIFFFPPL